MLGFGELGFGELGRSPAFGELGFGELGFGELGRNLACKPIAPMKLQSSPELYPDISEVQCNIY